MDGGARDNEAGTAGYGASSTPAVPSEVLWAGRLPISRCAAWVTQHARNLAIALEGTTAVRFLIRDRDAKFTRAFDTVWQALGTDVIRTPIQAPNANAIAERWIGTLRRECLDHLLITGRRHLLRVLHVYIQHYNRRRPHRSLGLSPPASLREHDQAPPAPGQPRRRDLLGGLIHEYEHAA
jgi:putative transposase